MTPVQIVLKMKENLPKLGKLNLGYSLGTNVIKEIDPLENVTRTFNASEGQTWLEPIYSVCDGLSFPDVHNGYFLKPLKRVLVFNRNSEPQSVVFGVEFYVIPIGSTGGGDLFVIHRENGSVLLLPPGPIKDGRYDGKGRKVRVVAESVMQFLECLLDDLVAFVNQNRSHRYLTTL